MNIALLAILLVGCIGSFFLVVTLAPRRYAGIAVALVALVWLAILGGGWYYVTHPDLRVRVDASLNPTTAHHTISTEPKPALPLPRHTAQRYRVSATAAVYYSKTPLPDALAFYHELDPSLTQTGTPEQPELHVTYMGGTFTVKLQTDGQGTRLDVAADP